MWSAAILAGGRAIRFGGRDKSALMVCGRRILDWQLEALSDIADDIMLVGGREAGGPTPRTPRSGRSMASIRLVADRVAGCGPLGGLEAALDSAAGDRLVLLACDMPFVTAPFLARLLTLTDEADAVVPRTARAASIRSAPRTRGSAGPP
jgi:molybdopterin-guanine dinucleotide biosynthesis protein A